MLQKWKSLNEKQQETILEIIFITALIIGACLFFLFVIKTENYYQQHPEERPVYITTTNTEQIITCTITNIDYRNWYASAHHFTADVSVKDNKSGFEESFHFTGDDAQDFEDYHTGDQIQATLITQTNTDTGEILNQYIHNIQP